MHCLIIDRRASAPLGSADRDLPRTTRIVRQGLLLQAYFGSVGAIEYLKTHEVGGELIARVLSGERLRREDRALLEQTGRSMATPDPACDRPQ